MEDYEKYPVRLEIAVQWGEMDAARHVNNVIYLRWMESCRIEYMKAISGKSIVDVSKVGPILGWQDCKYIYPMTFPDTALLGIKTEEVKPDRLILEGRIFSANSQRLCAISRQTVIAYDYEKLVKAPIPSAWLENIELQRL